MGVWTNDKRGMTKHRGGTGEFTLRAFLNGRLDLSQAEALQALLSAKSHAAADAALAASQGELSGVVREVRRECIDLLAEVEARVDFDEDLPPLDEPDLLRRVDRALCTIQDALSSADRGRLLQSGIRIAIVGRPNVGKSSLLNAWTQTERSIVTDIAGTTRDVVEAPLEVGGLPVMLLDTAGIRPTLDPVEKIGVQRSADAASSADVIVLVASCQEGWTRGDENILSQVLGCPLSLSLSLNGPHSPHVRESCEERLSDDVAGTVATTVAVLDRGETEHPSAEKDERGGTVPVVLVLNKRDLGDATSAGVPRSVLDRVHCTVQTSAVTGEGMGDLEAAVLEAIGANKTPPRGRAWALNERQARQLRVALKAMEQVRDTVRGRLPIDMCSTDLREGVYALGQVSGEGDVTEEVLSEIFGRFCIGK